MLEEFRTSYSALGNAATCPWKYNVYNVLRASVPMDSIAKVQGILVHNIVEAYHNDGIEVKYKTKKDQLQWLLATRDTLWSSKFTPDNLKLIHEYIDEYDDAIEDTKDYATRVQGKRVCKAPTWTHYWKRTYGDYFGTLEREKFGDSYKRVSHIFFGDEGGPYPRTTFLECYQYIGKCLTNFIDLHRSMPKAKELLVEVKPENNVKIHGFNKTGRIDRVAIFDDDSIHVHDFKTGRKSWTETEIANNDQLFWYGLIIKEMFGRLPKRLGIMDLSNGKEISYDPDESDFQRYTDRVQGSITYTHNLHQDIVNNGIDAAMKTRPIPLGLGSARGCECDLAKLEETSELHCPFIKHVKRTDNEQTSKS